ncbi:ATP-dependent nuclease [Lysobacter soli]|uniref:ATP-dependent nuclease n=1 Tax=Lysobacter soli TaxID=453783 RepID=UPI0015F25E75|nr:AAA family ATPase [Lysobacter soli]
MLRSVTLKFTEHDPITLDARGITIFVGPNNSGKSLALRELHALFENQELPASLQLLSGYDLAWPSEGEIDALLDRLAALVVQPNNLASGHVAIGSYQPSLGHVQVVVDRNTVQRLAREREKGWFTHNILRWGALRLDGRSRFALSNDQQMGDLLSAPTNALSLLFGNDAIRKNVQHALLEAFGKYFVLDPTFGGTLRIRLADTPPVDEQSLAKAARDYFAKAQYIKDASDGVQAYTGIITAVMSGEFHTFLVDEPEAFLHPPLARKLGKQLASLTAKSERSLFAATHSPDFLMGCLQVSQNVRVVRMAYANGKSKARVVNSEELAAFLQRPLMRSANVVSGLFHDGVVVTESDNDRAFYAEIYHRLSQDDPSLPSLLFVNAQNKQTQTEIIGPLRRFGVPTVGIVDIDVLKEGGTVWSAWLNASNVPKATHEAMHRMRGSIFSLFEGKDMKRDGGVSLLSPQDADAANDLFDSMARVGVFVVRQGEVEDWLKHHGVSGRKAAWALAMLERLGSDPAAEGYVRPGKDDVWEFMRQVANWVRDPARKGFD